MRFITSFSTALVSALLATTALGGVVGVIRSPDDLSSSALVDKRGVKLGADPRKPATKAFMKSYCSKAYKGKGKRELEARAQPAGYTNVPMGGLAGSAANGPGLWTGGIGTCVGVVITGTGAGGNYYNKFLAHIVTPPDWKETQDQLDKLATGIANHKLKNMQGWMLIIDTSLRSDPPAVQQDKDVQAIAKDMNPTYNAIKAALEGIVGGKRISVITHGFSHVDELAVNPGGSITRG